VSNGFDAIFAEFEKVLIADFICNSTELEKMWQANSKDVCKC